MGNIGEIDKVTLTAVERLEKWTREMRVQNADDRNRVFEAIKEVQNYKDTIVRFFADSKKKAHDAWKAIVANEKSFTDRLDAFEAAGKRAIVAFDQEEERKRIAEQRRLQAIADEQARKEREKQEAEARRQRQIEEEARAKAEAARQQAEAANAEEKLRLLKEAEAAERKAAAAQAKAETKEENAVLTVAEVVTVAPVAEKQKGESVKTIWRARVINADLVPNEYKTINIQALDAVAKATKGAIQIPGVEFYSDQTIAIRIKK